MLSLMQILKWVRFDPKPFSYKVSMPSLPCSSSSTNTSAVTLKIYVTAIQTPLIPMTTSRSVARHMRDELSSSSPKCCMLKCQMNIFFPLLNSITYILMVKAKEQEAFSAFKSRMKSQQLGSRHIRTAYIHNIFHMKIIQHEVTWSNNLSGSHCARHFNRLTDS